MARRRFDVFTPRHGDVVLTTRWRWVARLVTRLVHTLDYAPEGTEASGADTWAEWPRRGEGS